MGSSASRIAGADRTKTNNDLTNYVQALQVAARTCRLYKLSVSNLIATDLYLWFFDLAAGAPTSAAPVHVRFVPGTFADTWDFGPDGGVFLNGLYVIASTTAPAGIATQPTGAGNDKVIIKADYREI